MIARVFLLILGVRMKSLLLISFLSLLTTLTLIHCGSEKSESFSYDYEVNGCKTGKHSFDSKEALFRTLKSNSQFNYCAYQFRKIRYENECQGNLLRNINPYSLHNPFKFFFNLSKCIFHNNRSAMRTLCWKIVFFKIDHQLNGLFSWQGLIGSNRMMASHQWK